MGLVINHGMLDFLLGETHGPSFDMVINHEFGDRSWPGDLSWCW